MLNPTENFIRSNEDLLLNFMAQSTQNGSYLDADVRIGHKPFPFLNFSPIRWTLCSLSFNPLYHKASM